MLTPPAELAALGPILTQAAKLIPPAVAGGRVDRERRVEAYVEFQRASMGLITWVENMGPLQASGPPLWGQFAAALITTLPGFSPSERDAARLVSATHGASMLIFARFMAQELDYNHTLVNAALAARGELGRVLSSLAEVRLLGGPRPQQPAEEVVALLGELLGAMPVHKRTLLRSGVSSDERYRDCQRAAIDALRRFTIESRFDLRSSSRLPWRRRDRKHAWQIYRPRARILQPVDVDIEKLVKEAARARTRVRVPSPASIQRARRAVKMGQGPESAHRYS